MKRSVVLTAVVAVLLVALGLLWRGRGPGDVPSRHEPGRADRVASTEGGRSGTTAPDQALPSFDVVRVEPDGSVVMAGRAVPGGRIIVLDGDTPLGEATADPRGEWVLVPTRPLKPGTRELRLRVDGQGEPAGQPRATVTLVVPEAKRDIAGRPQPETGPALALLDPGTGASRVLQGPTTLRRGELSIDTIDYDRAGRVGVGGSGPTGGEIQLYLDNVLVDRGRVGADGRWSLVPDRTVPSGRHTLRVDRVGANGKVEGRVEVGFDKRPFADDMGADRAVVVVPGNNLWAIARRRYGEGPRYTLIFTANQEQIRDPDLIYPGQIFVLPTAPPPPPATR